nr:hypothetical protein [Tanacetum cinerariifolium]
MPGNVLQHHDGIVDHETGGNGHGHQGQVIDRKTCEVHDAEGAHQRQRHGNGRNDGGAEPAQEQEGDQHHQHDGNEQFVLHIADRSADGLGAVG